MNNKLLTLPVFLFALCVCHAASDSKDAAPGNNMIRRAEIKKPINPIPVMPSPGAPISKPANLPAAAALPNPAIALPAAAISPPPTMPGISMDSALHEFWKLLPIKTEFESTVKPLGGYHAPFTHWAHATQQEMQETMNKIQLSKSAAEMLALTEKAKPKFLQALKVAKAIAPIDSNVASLNNNIQATSACLAKRQAALQQADSKLKNAIDLAMTGLQVNVTPLDSLVSDAKAVCP